MISNRRLRKRRSSMLDEDINPMESAVNIVDAMLVFACGLMLSLVIYWNLDIQNDGVVQVEQGAEITEVENLEENINADSEEGEGEGKYQRMGSVYLDPDTGELYMMED